VTRLDTALASVSRNVSRPQRLSRARRTGVTATVDTKQDFFVQEGSATQSEGMLGQRYMSPLYGIVEVTADPGMATDIGIFAPENATPSLTHIAFGDGG
jgi:hypothetical protein